MKKILFLLLFLITNIFSIDNNLIIREVKISDMESLINLTKQLGYTLSFPEVSDKIKKLENSSTNFLYIAENNENVLGFVAMSVSEPFIYSQKKLTVDALVVDQNSRGFGIGKKLMELVYQKAKDLDCLMIELTSGVKREAAHKLYYSLGYNNCDRLYFRLYLDKK